MYRTIINQVIESVRPDFDDVGVEEAVLQELLRLWETKVAQSRVADFSNDARMGEVAKAFPMVPTGGNGLPIGVGGPGASGFNSATAGLGALNKPSTVSGGFEVAKGLRELT